MLVKDKSKRINVTELINSPYFDDLKEAVISGRLNIVEPYWICLYEFENLEINSFEKHINNIENSLKNSSNPQIKLREFILLKMKFLLYLRSTDDLLNYNHNYIQKIDKNILDNLFKNLDFKNSYEILLYECLLLRGSEAHRLNLNEWFKSFGTQKTYSFEVLSLAWELNAVQELIENKTPLNQVGSSIENAIRNYREVFNDKNIGINLTVDEENATCFYSFNNASVIKMDNLTSNILFTGTVTLSEIEENIVFYCDKFNPDDSVTTTFKEILFFFDYCKSDIKSFYTDWGSCQSDRSKNRIKYYTDANYATCCLITSNNEDCEITKNASKYTNITET